MDERHPLYLGNAALSSGDAIHCAIERADLIINVGHDVVEKPPFVMQDGGLHVIHVNFSSAEVDPVYFPQIEVIGDTGNSLWQIYRTIEPQSHWSFEYFLRVKEWADAKLAAGDDDDRFPVLPQRLVAVCGAGGFMMNSQELETAVRLGRNLVTLVLRDNAYGMIKWKQADMGLPEFGLDYGNPDFVRYAESYGAAGHRLERTDALAGLLKGCLREGGVHLIDELVDYSGNHKLLDGQLVCPL